MSVRFRSINRSTPYLLPPPDEWLPESHLARFVVDVVNQLDTSEIERACSGRGSDPWHPKLLIVLLFYGYATGVFSSRKLERASHDSVAFRYICGNEHPDHDSIAIFRCRFLPVLEGLFVQILYVDHEMGLFPSRTVGRSGNHRSRYRLLQRKQRQGLPGEEYSVIDCTRTTATSSTVERTPGALRRTAL